MSGHKYISEQKTKFAIILKSKKMQRLRNWKKNEIISLSNLGEFSEQRLSRDLCLGR